MLVTALAIAIAPAVLAGIIFLATGAWKVDAAARLVWSVPIAVGLGFVTAQFGIDGAPRLPPIEASGWFSLIALALIVVALTLGRGNRGLVWWVTRVAVTLVIVVTIVYPLFGGAWSIAAAIGWVLGMSAIIVLVWASLDATAAVAEGPGLPASLLVIASGVAAVLAMSGSARYGQLAGAVASVMGALTAVGLVRHSALLLRNGAWLAYLLLAMLMVAGITYVDVSVSAGIVVSAAPVALRIADIPKLRARPWWQRETVRVALAVVIVAIAGALALSLE